MRVVDAGNYRPSAQVDLLRVGTGKRLNFVGIATGKNAVLADRQSLHIGTGGAAGEYLAVVEDQIRCGGLCRSREGEEQTTEYGGRTLQTLRVSRHSCLRPQYGPRRLYGDSTC